uniref:Uncharacterized protein n=1 Tax=Caenorhabditis japonica TaxID=281687 RepID=A0A8R1E3B2_CAEJA
MTSSALLLLIALLHTVPPSIASGLRQNSHNRCFSCMSEMYEGFLNKGMDRYFNRPRNFSSQCDGNMDVTNMHTVPCRTICLTIQQDLVVMGTCPRRTCSVTNKPTLNAFGCAAASEIAAIRRSPPAPDQRFR